MVSARTRHQAGSDKVTVIAAVCTNAGVEMERHEALEEGVEFGP